jgi:hypothetical protein
MMVDSETDEPEEGRIPRKRIPKRAKRKKTKTPTEDAHGDTECIENRIKFGKNGVTFGHCIPGPAHF